MRERQIIRLKFKNNFNHKLIIIPDDRLFANYYCNILNIINGVFRAILRHPNNRYTGIHLYDAKYNKFWITSCWSSKFTFKKLLGDAKSANLQNYSIE